jgi:hypothetical protein
MQDLTPFLCHFSDPISICLFHCNRDFGMVEGFNPSLTLKRTQTIMQGASHCDFRFVRKG